jgi:aminobenzoyl-glutamate utilization protein B
VQALTALDLLLSPDALQKAWALLQRRSDKDQKYIPLIAPDAQPAIDLNKEKMEKFRPQMQKYYYGPAKYKTYLDQLGITYPTVKGP